MTWKLLQGDVLDKLSEIETGTVQTCVTSPPYWGLRDYGVEGQIGLEKTPEEYVEKMVQVFREVKRVLRDNGTVWINLGDCYSSGGMSNPSSKSTLGGGKDLGAADYSITRKVPNGLKPKDLVGIPWMVAFALRDDGWYLRSDIIWAKPNSMPESVTDRPTKSHEYIFLLTKSARYYYDAEAIRESNQDKYNGKRGDTMTRKKMQSAMRSLSDKESMKRYSTHGRNKRTVWTIATQPYPGAHFATFPPKLIEPCILAGTSPKACEVCGAPWERVVERKRINRQTGEEVLGGWGDGSDPANQHKGGFNSIRPETHTKTLGWRPTCTCENEGKGRCIVLDPFAGSGTTLWVAERFGRDSIGIEINPKYCELVKKRMSNFQQTIFKEVTL